MESEQLRKNLQRELIVRGLSDEIQVVSTGCFGFCEKGPLVKISPDNTFYVQVSPDDAAEIIQEHIINKQKVERLLYIHPETKKRVTEAKDMDFYKRQYRIALRNCGNIDPDNIEEYIARDGYTALAKCLTELSPTEVIGTIKKSGLRVK
jgi:NADH-quinone oxidoreductase subunit F/NADP-reducing hydrogenase subunit HndC